MKITEEDRRAVSKARKDLQSPELKKTLIKVIENSYQEFERANRLSKPSYEQLNTRINL